MVKRLYDLFMVGFRPVVTVVLLSLCVSTLAMSIVGLFFTMIFVPWTRWFLIPICFIVLTIAVGKFLEADEEYWL